MKHRINKFALITLVASALSLTHAQNFIWSLGGGVSQPIGTESQNFELGFNASTDFFLLVSPQLQLGGHIALNRWAPHNLFNGDLDRPIQNAITLYEIVPSARLSTANEYELINFFIQGGAGLYFKQQIPATLDQLTSPSLPDSLAFERHIGFNLGAGISLGDMNFMTVEILPLYHYLIAEEKRLRYFSIGVALSFRV